MQGELFFQRSLTNHSIYAKTCKLPCKHFYVVEFEGLQGRMADITLQLKNVVEFTYKSEQRKVSLSKDGQYKKVNGNVVRTKKLFETDKCIFQNDVFVFGYSLEEESTVLRGWADDETTEVKAAGDVGDDKINFQKETVELVQLFTNPNVKIQIYVDRIVMTLNSDINMDQYFSLIIQCIYPFTIYFLTKDEEKFVKNNTVVQEMKRTTRIFDYSYITDRKEYGSSVTYVINDYLKTIPCLRFSLNGNIYTLDQYDNLKKLGQMPTAMEEIIDQGFLNTHTNEFTSIEDVQKIENLLPKTSALGYKSKGKDGSDNIKIYTPVGNIYIDEIVDFMFTRRSYRPYRKMINHIFSRQAMDATRVKDTKKVIRTLIAQKDVRKFCKDLNIDYLLKMSVPKQKLILQECKKIPNSYLATFFVNMLSISSRYDEGKPIVIELTDGPLDLSATVINGKKLALEKDLEAEKAQIDVFHNNRKDARKFNFYSSVTKTLDQLKVYSREVEKRVHKPGSITNAWMKCWEMIHTFDLVPVDHPDTFTIFCNAEFPGAFILALNHYIKTSTKSKKYEWYANSLWPGDGKGTNKEIFKDSFKLYEKYPDRWLMNDKNGGSVLDPKMIWIIEDRLMDSVDLYTSDIGIGAEFDEEEAEAPLNLGQIICALKTLKRGGTMVCKMFLFFKPFNMSLLRLLCNVFEHFYVTKPIASRGGNSEIYIIGKGYKKNQDIIDTLMHSLKTWDKKSVDTYITPITEDFYVKLVYALYYIYKRQLLFLKKNMDIVKAVYDYFKGREPKYINASDIEKTSESGEFNFRKTLMDIWKNKFPVSPLLKADDL